MPAALPGCRWAVAAGRAAAGPGELAATHAAATILLHSRWCGLQAAGGAAAVAISKAITAARCSGSTAAAEAAAHAQQAACARSKASAALGTLQCKAGSAACKHQHPANDPPCFNSVVSTHRSCRQGQGGAESGSSAVGRLAYGVAERSALVRAAGGQPPPASSRAIAPPASLAAPSAAPPTLTCCRTPAVPASGRQQRQGWR